MPTIWIPYKTDKDISKVEAFGDPQLLFNKEISPFDLKSQNKIIRGSVLEFSTRQDYVLTLGPQLPVVNLACEFVRKYGFCRMLIYKYGLRDYDVRIIGDLAQAN